MQNEWAIFVSISVFRFIVMTELNNFLLGIREPFAMVISCSKAVVNRNFVA